MCHEKSSRKPCWILIPLSTTSFQMNFTLNELQKRDLIKNTIGCFKEFIGSGHLFCSHLNIFFFESFPSRVSGKFDCLFYQLSKVFFSLCNKDL